MTEYYDALETRSTAARDAALAAALPATVRAAQSTPAMAAALASVNASNVSTRAALASLPVTRKTELLERQKAGRSGAGTDEKSGEPFSKSTNVSHDPFGGFSTIGWRHLRGLKGARRVYQSPGPIYEPEGHGNDYWRVARALFAAGFRAGDLVHNSFSYHLTPGAWIMESGAQALGVSVFPGGVGNTDMQLAAIVDLRPDGYTGTPSFLRIALERAAETGLALPSLKKALVSGEAFPPSLRDWLTERGIAAYQCYATADVGLIAYETVAREGLVLDEGVVVEIVRPGTGDVLPDGEVGEVLVTALNLDYPLIRFGTGDLSAVMPGTCTTGRSNARIKGWLGRADQTAKVRGMFVHPSQVAEVLRRHPELLRARLVVQGEMSQDEVSLRAEAISRPEGLVEAVARSVRELTKLRCDVALLAPGSLPNDGKVIEDLRSYK